MKLCFPVTAKTKKSIDGSNWWIRAARHEGIWRYKILCKNHMNITDQMLFLFSMSAVWWAAVCYCTELTMPADLKHC